MASKASISIRPGRLWLDRTRWGGQKQSDEGDRRGAVLRGWSGRGLWVKVDSEPAAERIKQRLGFLPQGLGLNLYPELSVEENIDFFARLRLVSERDLTDRKAASWP
jgi:hypothetical protein